LGDDIEPVRTRKALGSVSGLAAALCEDPIYPEQPKEPLKDILAGVWEAGSSGNRERQRRLIDFEGLAFEGACEEGIYPAFDNLLDVTGPEPVRLSPGRPGRPDPLPLFRVRSTKDLKELIQRLVTDFDLSGVVIQALMKRLLCETLRKEEAEATLEGDSSEILDAFDRLFENVLLGEGLPPISGAGSGYAPLAALTRKSLWRCLAKTPIAVPPDFDRDGVRSLFRLLDAALLCRLPGRPGLAEEIREELASSWKPDPPDAVRNAALDWKALYRVEKAVNVYGRAAAAVLACLQKKVLFPELRKPDAQGLMESIVPGKTDPVSLLYFSSPVISHGRWALQAPVTVRNAHPFLDARRQRAVVLNGLFNGEVEASLRKFLADAAGCTFRSGNSTEYLSLLWGFLFERLLMEKRRREAMKTAAKRGFAHDGSGSPPAEDPIFQKIEDKSIEELDALAFVQAVRRITAKGGQASAAAISVESPRTMLVAAHNRPVFIVRRPGSFDFMVVSDVNAAMGLFPQNLVHEKTLELYRLRKATEAKNSGRKSSGRSTDVVRRQKAEERILKNFAVEVFPIEAEERFARIEPAFEKGSLIRKVTFSDFNGNPLPEVEPFLTFLRPETIPRDPGRTFYESHLNEIPERLEGILGFYLPGSGEIPRFDLKQHLLYSRFGQSLSGLRRVLLTGMGSAFHMSIAGANAFRTLLPDKEILCLRASETDEAVRTLSAESDLVLLSSWSGTTADTVSLGGRLLGAGITVIGVTEKAFSDLGLVARKSAGVIQVRSGEEITVSGVKSTACMLFCLYLLAARIAGLSNRKEKALSFVKELTALPEVISGILRDKSAEAFSKRIADQGAKSHAALVIDSFLTGTGPEAALKLEENSWTALGRILDYRDPLPPSARKDRGGHFILVNATHTSHMEDALSAMERLHAGKIPFAAIGTPGAHREAIARYAGGNCFFLPGVSDPIQPLVDLVFLYRMAFHYGIAHGRKAGEFPRNRAKSIAAGRTASEAIAGPAEELRLLEESNRGAQEIPRTFLSGESLWEKQAGNAWERGCCRSMGRLSEILIGDNPLKDLVTAASEDIDLFSGRLIEQIRQKGEVVLIPLDRPAEASARNLADRWRPFLRCRIRVVRPETLPISLRPDSLPLVVATEAASKSASGFLEVLPEGTQWFGPENSHDERPESFRDACGGFGLKGGMDQCTEDTLYAAISFLFVHALRKIESRMAETIAKSFRLGAGSVLSMLNDASMKNRISEAMAANRSYRNALFISPHQGSAMTWTDRFDRAGNLFSSRRLFGESAHGSLVLVDPEVGKKYVPITSRSKMCAVYGEKTVALWENRYLGGKDIEGFLLQADHSSGTRVESPFFSEGSWYLPELADGYDAANDTLVIIDAADDRYFDRALDEISTFGCRYARMIVLCGEGIENDPAKQALAQYPVSHVVPVPGGSFCLPIVMDLLATAVAFS